MRTLHTFTPEVQRWHAPRLALFNHKGGVGKTTLTVNIAAALADQGHRVLVVDTDPQCNLTSYYLNDNVVDELLRKSETDEGQTIWSAIRDTYEYSAPPKAIAPRQIYPNRELYLVPGDIQLSRYEQELDTMWTECFQRKARGYNGTVAISQLINSLATTLEYDFIFYDCGPNIGALNRTLLLDVDYFIVPGACDQFSVRALTTLGITLTSWVKDWQTISSLVPDSVYRMPGKPSLIGFVLQRFRVYRKVMASQFSAYRDQFEDELRRNIFAVLHQLDSNLTPVRSDNLELGLVEDFGSRALKAQTNGQTLDEVGSATQKDETHELFQDMADEISVRIARRPKR